MIILGGMTQVAIDGVTDGFQSISWDINRQPNRLWQLGSWDPWKTQVGATLSVSVTSYAEALSPLDLAPSTSCTDSTAVKRIQIDATTCDPYGSPISIDYDKMFLTSYNYNKSDPIGFGTETWSFQRWIDSGVVGQTFIPIPTPTYVLQGRAEGNRTGTIGDPPNNPEDLGIRFLTPTTTHVVTGERGSVTAGFPGIGQADEIEIGLVNRVGGGLLESGGRTGQSQATVPHVPLYFG